MKHEKKDCFAIGIDAEKAYDSVEAKFVADSLQSLHELGRCRHFLMLLMMPRFARIRLENTLSSKFICSKGLPQGTTLGCIIFCLVFDSFVSLLNRPSPSVPSIGPFQYGGLFFADDALGLRRGAQAAQNLLDAAVEWGNANGFKFVPRKSFVCPVGVGIAKAKDEQFEMYSTPVEIVTYFTYLGSGNFSRKRNKWFPLIKFEQAMRCCFALSSFIDGVYIHHITTLVNST
jgi:hypothetical protein